MSDSVALLLLLVTVVVAIGLATHVVSHRRLDRAARQVAHEAAGLRAALSDALQRLQTSAPDSATPAAAGYCFMRPGGVPQGPVELTTLRAMVADGRLGADALVAVAGKDPWRPVLSVLSDIARLEMSQGE